MKSIQYFFLIFFFFFSTSLNAQIKLADSLLNVLKNTVIDEKKTELYYKLAKVYIDNEDSANAVNSFNTGIKIATEKKLHQWVSVGLNEKGYLYELMNENNTALAFYRQAINYSKKHSIIPELGKAYKNTAFTYYNLGKLDAAVAYDDSTIAAFTKAGMLLEIANGYNNQGLHLHYLNKNSKALDNYQKAITIYDKLKEEKRKTNTIVNIGLIHLQQKNYDLALDNFFTAKSIAIKTNNLHGQRLAENNIGVVYFEQKKFADAIPHYENALEMAKTLKNVQAQLMITTNLGSCYESMENLSKAENYYKSAEIQLLKTTDYESILTNYINQASLAGKQKNFKECLAYIDKCFYYINNFDGLTKYKHYVFENAAYANKMLGNVDKAFMLQDSQLVYKDISINEKTNAELLNLQTKYETEKKQLTINLLSKADSIKTLRIENQTVEINAQQLRLTSQQLAISQSQLQIVNDSLLIASNSLEIANKNEIINTNQVKALQQQQDIANLSQEKRIKDLEINKKNTLLLGLGLLATLLLLGGYFFYKSKQQQNKNYLQALLFEQQTKSTINILTAEEKERKRIASDLHDGVGQLMTAAWLNMQALQAKVKGANEETVELLNKTMHLVDESCKEVRAVSHNMMPNALLKKGLVNAVKEFLQQINVKSTKINLQTDNLSKPLPSHVETVLYRVIQESVNNVIKHAQATSLDISIMQDVTGIDVMIEDNGKGFNFNEVNKKEGIGLLNVKSRIEYLNGTVEWNTAENKGTLVAIHIPEIKA